jgi:hypothetical protein
MEELPVFTSYAFQLWSALASNNLRLYQEVFHQDPEPGYTCHVFEAVTYGNLEALEWLLQQPGAWKADAYMKRRSPLAICLNANKFKLLADSVDPSQVNFGAQYGQSALDRAIIEGFDVLTLLRKGAQEGQSTNKNDTFRGIVNHRKLFHPQADLLLGYPKIVSLTRASRDRNIGLSVDLIRQVTPYLYFV